MNAIRTMVVEDHEVMRFGLVTLLKREPDIQVVAEAGDARAALHHLETLAIDLVLLDLSLPDLEGMQLIRLIAARASRARILISTMHDELRYGHMALAAGARGYIMKSAHPEELIAAVRTVASGQIYTSAALKAHIEPHRSDAMLSNDARASHLTNREVEVLRLLGLGLSSNEIASQLHRSVKTVDAHRENIKKKMALRNANELLRYAVCWVEEEAALYRIASPEKVNETTHSGMTYPLPLSAR